MTLAETVDIVAKKEFIAIHHILVIWSANSHTISSSFMVRFLGHFYSNSLSKDNYSELYNS